MIPRLPSLVVTALLALSATGCRTFVPFTQEIREQNHLSETDLRNLQFYVSNTITLRREVEAPGRNVTGNHKLLVLGGKTIEEVVVEAKTPGICVGVAPHSLSISFEQGTSIDFAPDGGGLAQGALTVSGSAGSTFASPPPEPFPGNQPRAGEQRDIFSGGYNIVVGPQSTVKFLGRTFDAFDDTVRATLLIDGEALDDVAKQRKVLPGLRLAPRT
jgi:hypothetical protein